jgi:hypothetical protein
MWVYSQGAVNWWGSFPYKQDAINGILNARSKYDSKAELGYTVESCASTGGNNGAGFCFIDPTPDKLFLDKTVNGKVFGNTETIKINMSSNGLYAGYCNVFVNGVIISKPLSLPYDITFSNLKNGYYEVYAVGYAATGKQMFSNPVSFTVDNMITSLMSHNENITTNVVPNPFQSVIHLPENQSWILYNTAGQLIKEGVSADIEASDIQEGIYMLILENGRVLKVQKL